MAAVLERLRAEGRTVSEEDIARLWPARYEHIDPYGKYRSEVQEGLSRTRLLPLRTPLLSDAHPGPVYGRFTRPRTASRQLSFQSRVGHVGSLATKKTAGPTAVT